MGNLDAISMKPFLNQIIEHFIEYAGIIKHTVHFLNMNCIATYNLSITKISD